MAKTKKRKKAKRRSGDDERKTHGGAMMGLRSGFKGVAGSLVGKEVSSKRARRVVDIFWWVVTAVLGAAAIYFLYQRYSR